MPETASVRRAVRLRAEDHRAFAAALLTAAGAGRGDAETVADALLWADLRGRHTNGLVRLPNAVQRLRKGLIRSPAHLTWSERAPAVHLLDADHALGHVAAAAAMDRAVELARAQGIGAVAVRHGNHFGTGAYFCARAAEAGCLALALTNAFPKVAAHGGRAAVLGTNPIAFASPTRTRGPILVDLSTSAISGAEVRSTAGKREALPEGVAFDAEGRPTRDPAAIATGCLLPAAGPKGFALALMVEILTGVLSGSSVGRDVGSLFQTWDRPVDVGQLFVALDIARFLPPETFLDRLEGLLDSIVSSPRMEEEEPIRIPGEIRAAYADVYARGGIPIPAQSLPGLEQAASEAGVPVPWAYDAGPAEAR
jgi:LDH2 family malate/lactate/ureidoglycolate dehydrogenase